MPKPLSNPVCFVAAEHSVDLQPVRDALRRAGVEPRFSTDFPASGHTVAESVKASIKASDLVVGVFSGGAERGNVLLELGMALGYGKPALIVAPLDVELPSDLAGLLTVRSTGGEYEGLRFALEQLMLHGGPHERPRDVASPTLPIAQPIGALGPRLASDIDQLGAAATERHLVQALAQALKRGGATVAEGDRKARFDLGIWDPHLQPLVGNPFVIEVKKELTTPNAVEAALSQVERYLAVTSGRWALLVYGSVGDPQYLTTAARHRPVLTIELRRLLMALESAPFDEVIRRLRNDRVHGTLWA